MLMVLITLVAPAGLAFKAKEIESGSSFLIGGFINLSPNQASKVFWVLSAISIVTFLVVVWLAVRNHLSPSFIELNHNGLVVPKVSISMLYILIPYSTIIHVQTVQIHAEQMIVIKSSVGNSNLMSSSFKTLRDFAIFLQLLRERTFSNISFDGRIPNHTFHHPLV